MQGTHPRRETVSAALGYQNVRPYFKSIRLNCAVWGYAPFGIQKTPGDSESKTGMACGNFGLKKAGWQKRGTRFLVSRSTLPTKVPSTNLTKRPSRREAEITELR